MPITKSAKKSLRASLAKRKRNQQTLKALEIALKKVSVKNFSAVVSKIDKAAKNRVVSRRRADRLKSRFSRALKIAKPEKRATAKPNGKAKTKKIAKSKKK